MTTARYKFEDSAANPIFNMTPRATAPTSAATGDIYLDDGTNTASTSVGWRYYNGSSWEDLTASSGGSGATTALDNLASVQVNTDIIPDAADTHDLGSASAEWASIWVDAAHAVSRKMRVYNSTAGTLSAGSWVYITGTQTVGGVILFTVDLADRDAAATSRAIGVIDSDITASSEGVITMLGEATVTTTGESVGDILYLSSTPGAFTTTRPTSGIIQELGVVGSVGASGLVAVNPGTDINLAATETLTNKTIDGANNTISNAITHNVVNNTYTPASAYTTNSTSYVDVDATNVAITITLTGGGETTVTFTWAANKTTAGTATYRITDGTNNSGELVYNSSVGTAGYATLTHTFSGLSSGSTTFKLQFKSSDANNAVVGVPTVIMNVQEIVV